MHIVLLFITISYLTVLLLLWRGCQNNPNPARFTQKPFVSVIIAAKNEEGFLGTCLLALKKQTWPQSLFEVIVANDHSTDATPNILYDFQSQFNNFTIVNNPRGAFFSSKKNALNQAMHQAQGEILLFTDADCQPPAEWIENMLSFFSSDVGLVAGFSPQVAQKKMWSRLLRLDALSAAFVAAGTIGWGRGVTCTGRNLAVRKSAFEQAGGYSALPDTLSGDDDFVLQRITKTDWKIVYALHKQAVVPAHGPGTLAGLLRQKSRHISAGSAFTRTTQIGYAFYHTLNFVIWAFFITSFFSTFFYAVPFVLKLVFDFYFLSGLAHKVGESVTFEMLLWQPLFLLYNITSAFSLRGKQQW